MATTAQRCHRSFLEWSHNNFESLSLEQVTKFGPAPVTTMQPKTTGTSEAVHC
jgi:hypothetical protein